MAIAAGETLPYKDLRKDNLDFTVTADGSNQVTLDLTSSVAIDCFVDWGDGTINFISSDTDANKTHTYSSGGDKRIKIYPNGKNGTLGTHQFFTKSDLVSLNRGRRGNLSFSNWYYLDYRLNSAYPSSIGSWDMSSVTDFRNFFRGRRRSNQKNRFNQDIGGWDTSSVTSMYAMFRDASAFDQNISKWDFSSLDWYSRGQRCLAAFFLNGQLSTSNYDALLVKWASQASSIGASTNGNLSSVIMGTSTYTAGSAAATARNTLVNTYGWSITDGGTA